ncbi:BrnA antitoxin family protein [Treponema primitia]|uniref:BrnA antitoxin family protein n=1 Tax=Treponema primitia TaxID=88058 RepID=UPI0009D9ADEE|nr:BrnA antitoxin family protein [Treponema primitia]
MSPIERTPLNLPFSPFPKRVSPGAHSEYWKVEPVKVALSIKIDADVLDWFKSKGKGYQTRINAVLRETMLHSD